MPGHQVIDLSHWNTIPESLRPAREAGVRGVIHKATEGATSVDAKYGARRYLARQAALRWGAYHFLRPGDMLDQARAFIDYAQPDERTLLAADHEDNRVSLADLATWLDEVERLVEIRPIIYSSHVLKEQLAGSRHDRLNGDHYRLWLAQYGPEAELPPGWDSYFLWQWTQSGSIAGVTPPTDLNDYQGTTEELVKAWTGGNDQ